MAERLTVDSSAVTNRPVQQGAQEPINADDAEFDRLKVLAKKRGGTPLTDAQLKNIIQRRKAKAKKQTGLDLSKASFEAEQSSETIGRTKDSAQVQTQKTTGTTQTRSEKDGLTTEARQSITSDPDAGPTLPPATSHATTPEQAKNILGPIFEYIEIDGQPIDPETYATTIKQQPPSKPKSLTQTKAKAKASAPPLGKQGQARPAASRPSVAMPPRGNPPQAARTARPTLSGPGGSTTTGAMGLPSSNAAVFRPAATSTARSVQQEPSFNAGGGLTSKTSWDGMNFNWDGFFSLFLIKSEKDLAQWRKAMRQFISAIAKFEQAEHQLGMKMLGLRKKLEETNKGLQVGKAIAKTGQLLEEQDINDIAAPPQEFSKIITKHNKAREQALEGTDFQDAHWLTEADLQSLPTQNKMDDAADAQTPAQIVSNYQDAVRKNGGAAYRIAHIRAEINRLQKPGPPSQKTSERIELLMKLDTETQADVDQQWRDIKAHPTQIFALQKRRKNFHTIASKSNLHMRENKTLITLETQLKQEDLSTDNRKKLEDKANNIRNKVKNAENYLKSQGISDFKEKNLQHQEELALRVVRQIDVGLSQLRTTSEEFETSIPGELKRAKDRVGSDPESKASWDRQQKHIAQLLPTSVSHAINDANGNTLIARGEAPNTAMTHLGDLRDSAIAGEVLFGINKDVDPSLLEAGGALLSKFDTGNVADGPFTQAVETAIGTAIGYARKNRQQANAQMMRTVGKSRGMINQLVQLMGMSRRS